MEAKKYQTNKNIILANTLFLKNECFFLGRFRRSFEALKIFDCNGYYRGEQMITDDVLDILENNLIEINDK